MNMDMSNRKQNRLFGYDYGQEGCYFVTLCTRNRARLFVMEPIPGEAFPVSGDLYLGNGIQGASPIQNQIIHRWIREAQNKFPNITIDKYVVMPDHLHLIVTLKERHVGRSLPDVMRFFKTMTTNEYIRGVKNGLLSPFDKKLWQKSYYDHVIRNEQDYNEIWEYIENNPAKWMMLHEIDP